VHATPRRDDLGNFFGHIKKFARAYNPRGGMRTSMEKFLRSARPKTFKKKISALGGGFARSVLATLWVAIDFSSS
jgi:hypothetical protein